MDPGRVSAADPDSVDHDFVMFQKTVGIPSWTPRGGRQTHVGAEGFVTLGIAFAADGRMRVTPTTLCRLIHEGFLVHWYVVGRTWAGLMRDARMLERIT